MKRLLKKIAAIVATAAVAVSAFVLPTTTASAKGPFDGAVKMEFMEYYDHNFQSAGEVITYKVDIKKRGTLYLRCLNPIPRTGTTIFNSSGDVIMTPCDSSYYNDRLSIQVQHSYEKNFLSTSKGVRKFKRFLGRLFISSTMFCKSSSEMSAKEVPFGKNCRSRPLVFSFVPRCHGE